VTKVADVSRALELDQECHDEATHVVVDLPLQGQHFPAVPVKGYDIRLVAAGASGGQNAIPELGISVAACRAHVQALVEVANLLQRRPPDCHGGTSTDLPGWTAALAGRLEEVRAIVLAAVPTVKAPMLLEDNLGIGFELGRENEPGDNRNMGLSKGLSYSADPVFMENHIIVGERDDRALAASDACVAGDIKPPAWLPHVSHPRVPFHQPTCGLRRGRVVDHDDLERSHTLTLE
jgi:hypothetical protein